MPDPPVEEKLTRKFLYCDCGTANGGGGSTWLTLGFSTASESPADGVAATPVCNPRLLVVTLLMMVSVSRTKLMEYPERITVFESGCQATPMDGARLRYRVSQNGLPLLFPAATSCVVACKFDSRSL